MKTKLKYLFVITCLILLAGCSTSNSGDYTKYQNWDNMSYSDTYLPSKYVSLTDKIK